jgi:DNA polymerase elongation subunit (family B)
MSYIDAILDRDTDRIHVVERVNGKRLYNEYPANYVFYYDDPRGKHRTIYNTPVTRFSTRSSKEFRRELKMHEGKRLWESDINPVFRCLSEHYLNADAPKMQVAFVDIETDFDPKRGFSSPEEAFSKITAITVHLQWLDQLVTLAMPPSGMSMAVANDIAVKFDNTVMFDDEALMLQTFLDLIEDADIVSGWNSEGYDIPYLVTRTVRILSKDDTRKFCLWGQLPKKRTFERFGAEQITYDLVGRVHVDYMQLYRKYTYEERHSYSLDAIGEYELDEKKIQYEGTLDTLYNQDFEKFIAYNRQDVALLDKLDRKLKFMDLANQLAHENTVLLPTTMGAVAVTEQAIINHAHKQNLIVPNRRNHEGDTQAAGAYVAFPKRGMHDWIGAIDINSLYPSAIRALNMGPETVVGQLRPTLTDQYISDKINLEKKSFADAWENMFGTLEYTAVMERRKDVNITIDWEPAGVDVLTAREVHDLIFASGQKWILSANGTIFKWDQKGIIPDLLETWYAERKVMQGKMKNATESDETEFWDKRQLVKKINLNSLYGAILNPGCRFFDKRIGQSTTLTGRAIAKHMDSFVNEAITGEYNHVGDAVIYGDTDSVYFSAWPIIRDSVLAGETEWNKEVCIQVYDAIAVQLNDSFPGFMERAFNCPRDAGAIIRGGRELIATKGLFIKKKRYGVLIYDLEGKRLDVNSKSGKVKAMGLDLKRSDTPKFMQEFLSHLLQEVLNGADKDAVVEMIKEFKKEFKKRPAWEKGTPKRVNNLTNYTRQYEKTGRCGVGHVMAAINWNRLRKMNGDQYSGAITDGQKVIVCKLKSNPLNITSVAYPTDQAHLPEWFKDLPFDNSEMEDTIVTQKVENLLGVLDWDLRVGVGSNNAFADMFSLQ